MGSFLETGVQLGGGLEMRAELWARGELGRHLDIPVDLPDRRIALGCARNKLVVRETLKDGANYNLKVALGP
ncbi:Uncharacterised protein [Mycobacteroides abscessus subsp. massiliense]|nr:Uncharacterised protein [Mycobacteroides abscessus subsp. massiliense]